MIVLETVLDPPITDQAGHIDRIWDLFLYLGLAVVAFVVLLILYVIVRYRRRGDELPRQKHYNIPIEVTYTVVPLLVVLVLFAITVVSVNAVEDSDGDTDLIVDVTAFQWQWSFEYPEAGVAVNAATGDTGAVIVMKSDFTVRFVFLPSPTVSDTVYTPSVS